MRVGTADALSAAIAAAKPGEMISLAPGTYVGEFVATTSGRQRAPITLCGGRDAILQGESIRHGYVVYLKDVSWWRLEGFTVAGGQKGVVADHATDDLIYGLYVHDTGDEAIHLRAFSSDDVVSHCAIRHTGLGVQFFGEGIYVGSANKNWCRYTSCKPDRSDDDKIVDNDIADTSAENIDIKEGTTGGLILGNHLDGKGMVAAAATAWINVKGNDWTIKDNTGIDSNGDGFAVHQVYPGWGIGNVFIGNNAQVDGPGVGIYVQSRSLKTVVACSNTAHGAAHGLSNQPCKTP
ncbi:MAG TPA: hypothetical protein VFI65_00470 [Streptosporangiaceae bacterium]|nr:hypothetical protein [Streptosporangiaceae bacterium]